jgi:hypothetical protein
MKSNTNIKIGDTIINSSTYDEMKFFDDWISYMKANETTLNKVETNCDGSHPFSENIVDEHSSFSSVINLCNGESEDKEKRRSGSELINSS